MIPAPAQRLSRCRRVGDLDMQETRRFHAELLRYAIMRRYRSAWVRRTFRDRFGFKPPVEWMRDEQATSIRPESYKWIRSRSAAYARSIESGRRS